jgi:hypothetical protein
MVRLLAGHLSELLAQMESGSIFSTAPAPSDVIFDPPEGSTVLSDEWRLSLVSTTVALAKALHLEAEVSRIVPDYIRFAWASPDNIRKNPYVRAALNLNVVAQRFLKADEAAHSS